MSFPKIPSHPNFYTLQEEILQFWEENNIFEKSINQRSSDNSYRFYDWPPFKNGLPHYGHALQSTIKDIIPRFWSMKGKKIERKRWWDCHGIYIEQKVQKKLGLESNKDIEAYGIDKFMKACLDFTNEANDEWDRFIPNLGRRVDFRNAYETSSPAYMESVRWVFKNLWEKDLIYKGKRVSMYSTKLNTAISSFEVQADNSYAEIPDPAITVKFPVNGYNTTPEFKWKHEFTNDWFAKIVRWIITNEKGEILHLYDIKHWNRCLPWGKVDKWETQEEAIKREVLEELWIEVSIVKKISSVKYIHWNHCWERSYFELKITSWVPKIQEKNHTEISYIDIFESTDNSYWVWYKVNWLIFEDQESIIKENSIIFRYKNIVQKGFTRKWTSVSFLARTTTPRTIPANLALVVSPDITYAQIYDLKANEYFILAENLISKFYKDPSDYLIIYKCKWTELEGISYKPPFDFYGKWGNSANHQVYLADYVTDTDGTGIVHTAPEFWEDDFKTGLKYGLTQSEALDEAGKYTNEIYSLEVPDLVGMYYRDANDVIMYKLKEKWLLVKKESITHTVAICPRTQVPLIFKTQDSRFINIQSVKEKLIERCKEINRVPDHLRLWRFLKNIESAPDRCISRTRYRATPMPVWTDGNGNYKVIWSMEDLFALDQTGSKILEKRIQDWKTIYRDTLHDQLFDSHRPWIDNIRWLLDGMKYIRVTEVLDPWLDSGSMPYAQDHYPFENEQHFKDGFPADFIWEWLGQIRAWFYVMHVLWVTLFDTVAYKNVICTGTVLGNDGRKMSKSFGNYPDIKPTIESYGADSIRMFFANSPLLNGWDQPFTEDSLREIIKKIHLPLWNSFSFFVTYANIDNFTPTKFSINDLLGYNFENDLDSRIIWKTAQLISEVDTQIQAYSIQKATAPIYDFLDDLTNRYIRRSRRRFRKGEMDNEKLQWYETLFVVLVELCKVLAPFMPFLSEYIFKALTGKESVHLEDRTVITNIWSNNQKLLADMDLTKQIVELGLSLRWSLKCKVKQPLQSLKINKSINPAYEIIIKEELNIKELIIDESLNNQITVTCVPNARIVGKKLWSRFAEINNLAKSGQFTLLSNNKAQVSDIILESDEYELRYEKWDLAGDLITSWDLILMLDTTITPELKLEWYARELIRSIQEARKSAWYAVTDRISLSVSWFEADQIINNYGEFISSETLSTLQWTIENSDHSGECDVDDGVITFSIKR